MADIGAIYKFISQTNTQNWDDWAKNADLDNDGYVIKAEFEEWLSEMSLTNFNQTTVDEFWYSVDTNRSAARIEQTDLKNLHAITKDEMAKMEDIVKQAEVLNGLNITAPTELAPALRPQYIKEVTDALNTEFNEFSQGKLSAGWTVQEAYERIQIEKSQVYILRDLQEYEYAEKLNNIDYNFNEDNAIIDKLFATCLNNAEIKERIASHSGGVDDGAMAVLKEVLLNFLATANITSVANETKDYEGWSVLQEKALAHKIHEQLLNDPNYCEILTDDAYMNELAVQGYAYDVLHASTSYDAAENSVYDKFINDPAKQIAGIEYYFNDIIKNNSESLINNAAGELFTKLDDADEGGVLTDLYLSSYGEEVRNDVKEELLEKVENGTISTDIKTEVINGLYNHIEDLFQTENGKSGYVKFENVAGYGYDYVNDLHDARKNVILKQAAESEGGTFNPSVVYGGENTLRATFNAFEQYCAALINMGGTYKDAVNYVEKTMLNQATTVAGCSLKSSSTTFSAAFEDMIKTLASNPENASSIDSVINSWTQLIRNAIECPQQQPVWTNSSITIKENSSDSITVCNGYTQNGVNKTDNLTFTCTPDAGIIATIANTGTLTITTPEVTSDTSKKVVVTAYVNNEPVGTQTISIKVVNVRKEIDNSDLSGISGCDNLYYDGTNYFSTAKEVAKTKITNLLENIETTLKATKKYEESAISNTVRLVKAYLDNIINNTATAQGRDKDGCHVTVSYDNTEIPSEYRESNYVYVQRDQDSASELFEDCVKSSESGIYMAYNGGGNNGVAFRIDKAVVANIFMDFFKYQFN